MKRIFCCHLTIVMLLAGTTAAVAADGARPTSATSIQQMRLPTALLSQGQIIPRNISPRP